MAVLVEQLQYTGVVAASIVNITQQLDTSPGREFRFRTLALTSDYLDAQAIRDWGHTLKNKELRWRHDRLEEKPASFLGMVEDVEIEERPDGKVYLWANCVVFGETDEQIEVVGMIRESLESNDPIGHSVGYIKITDEESEEVIRVFFRELSTTPFPKCEECRVDTILAESMTEAEASVLEVNTIPPDNPTAGVSGAQLESFMKSVTSSTKMLEARLKEMEEERKKLQTDLVKAEVVVDQLKKKAIKLEARRKSDDAKINALRAKVAKLEERNRRMTTVPLRIRIAEEEGIKKSEHIEARASELESLSEADLMDRLKSIRLVHQRHEIRARGSRPARVGRHQMSGPGYGRGRPQTMEQQMAGAHPIQLADMHYPRRR